MNKVVDPKKIIIDAVNKALENLCKVMKNHAGVRLVMQSRLKFEKWFQVELLREFITLLKEEPAIEIKNEYPVALKTSKKGETMDIAFFYDNQKYLGI